MRKDHVRLMLSEMFGLGGSFCNAGLMGWTQQMMGILKAMLLMKNCLGPCHLCLEATRLDPNSAFTWPVLPASSTPKPGRGLRGLLINKSCKTFRLGKDMQH